MRQMEIQDLPPPMIRSEGNKEDDQDISETSDSQAHLVRKMKRSETAETTVDVD